MDSNRDWGQDLKVCVERNGIPAIKPSYPGTGDPVCYGIAGGRLPGGLSPRPRTITREIRPGDLVAVSAPRLHGVPLDPDADPLMDRFAALTPPVPAGLPILIHGSDCAWSPRGR